MKLFKELTTNEEAKFRAWARKNYVVFKPINGLWHPTIQDECRKMNQEYEFDDGWYFTTGDGTGADRDRIGDPPDPIRTLDNTF